MDAEKGVRRLVEKESWFESLDLGPANDLIFWLSHNWLWLTSLIIALTVVVLIIKYIRRRRDQIQKLWVFILFFLTKRQMMLPLIITLSQKDNLLDEELRVKLMEIRDKCREVSFKRYPDERLEIEEHVSKILFFYFSSLEKKDQIIKGTKFAKLVKDLEFIDAKLVQLQKVYNAEVHRWNRWTNLPVVSLLSRIIGAAPFRAFK